MAAHGFAPAFRVEVNSARLSAEASRNITDLTVVHEPDAMDHFSLMLANPYPAMRWTHSDDADLFREGNAVAIAMGYVDDLHPVFDGEITSISPDFPQSGTPTVRVEGYSRLHRLAAGPRTCRFPDVTDTEVARRIAQAAGLMLEADESGTSHPELVQYNESDLAFLLGRAARIAFEVLVDGRTLIFRRRGSTGAGAGDVPVLTWGRSLLRFSPTMNTRRPVVRVEVRGFGPSGKQPIRGRAGTGDEDDDLGGSETGAQVAARVLARPSEDVRVGSPVATQEEADQLARAIYNDRAGGFLTGEGACVGLPGLRAGGLVDLDGLGRFSGQYRVARSTHTIGSAGYVTTFSVRRNAIS